LILRKVTKFDVRQIEFVSGTRATAMCFYRPWQFTRHYKNTNF